MLVLATFSLAKALTIVAYAILLGVGFWISKKMTNQVDYWMVVLDKKKMEALAQHV
jgi:hypothetical protein